MIGAAEIDLRAAGARLFLASAVAGGAWQPRLAARGYELLTLYLAGAGFGDTAPADDIRMAAENDVPGIVERSAENRSILAALDAFWTPHPEADVRFRNWMKRSLTLADRDMLVIGKPGALSGYAIAQPASRLHFPPTHDLRAVGFVDDYFQTDFSDPAALSNGGASALALLRAAESAFARRGVRAALVVCPAAWTSKMEMLQSAGYRTALVWMRKRPAA